jgi:GrpB-like predicted nucleotidyltransferase (UPF0157 family)
MREASANRRAIFVLDYDPAWPVLFEAIRTRLQALLGDLVFEVCHIGSTAVPGLCAKPKIDIDVVLRDASAVALGTERMQSAGYTFHGDRYSNGMWSFTIGHASYGERVNLCASGTVAHEDRLLFRNYLRSHPDAAAEYGNLKRRLAAETDNDWDFYTGGKGPFIAEIVARARRHLAR